MTMTSQHTADAAGGEAIYSSDALPPLPIPPPPPSIPSHAPEDVLDYDGHGDGRHTLGMSKGTYGQWSSTSVRETREEKLDRIARELKEMEANDGEEDHLSSKVEDLKQKLNQMSYGNLLSRRLESSSANDNTSANTNASASLAAASSMSTVPSNANADARLLQIEKVLGSDGGVASHSTSILERLRIAEEQLRSVDEKSLTVAASRAKVIRADLEAAAKARSKLSSSSSNSAQDTNKISKLYTQLIDLDGFLTGTTGNSNTAGSSSDGNGGPVGNHGNNDVLATIVNRLTSCADLHARSSHFGSDLNVLEGMMGDVKVLLASLEETVGKLENGMEENMKVIKDNMDELDKRLG